MTISELRQGLAANLAAIPGLRTTATIPEKISPPLAVVMPGNITFDTSFGRGLDEYEFTVMVIVGKVDDRSSQNRLDGFCNPSGAGSIKQAVEADRTLGGAAQTLQVKQMRNYQQLIAGDTQYLAAEFVVQVYA